MLWQAEGRIPNMKTRVPLGRELRFTLWYRGVLALKVQVAYIGGFGRRQHARY